MIMENSRFSKIFSNLPKIIIFVLVLLSLVANGICFFYINELEIQIDQRDSIISKLTFSNDLVKEYFDIIEDSVSQKTLYTLKEDKKIVQTKTEYINQPVFVEHTFTKGDEVITTEDLLSIANNKDSVNLEKLKALSEEYNSLAKKYNETQNEVQALRDTILFQSMALGLIKRNFDIDYTYGREDNTYHVSLQANKADSAFVIFPYFKNKMKYDEKTNSWKIKM